MSPPENTPFEKYRESWIDSYLKGQLKVLNGTGTNVSK